MKQHLHFSLKKIFRGKSKIPKRVINTSVKPIQPTNLLKPVA
uniref:Uncharacterized protein n=1 Tax=Rhizophora mucronata TaxID=61149 RepID=A0A2P2NYB5_RHIMU